MNSKVCCPKTIPIPIVWILQFYSLLVEFCLRLAGKRGIITTHKYVIINFCSFNLRKYRTCMYFLRFERNQVRYDGCLCIKTEFRPWFGYSLSLLCSRKSYDSMARKLMEILEES